MCRNRISIILLTLIISLIFSTSYCHAMKDFVENIDNGCMINWTTGALVASGFQEIEKNSEGEFIDSEKAMMAAKQMAHNNLLKAAKSVRINGQANVGEFAGKEENIMVKLMEMIKNTAVSSQQYTTNGSVEVFMEMSFFGGFSQLMLPKEIQHVESISLTHHTGIQPPVSQEPLEQKEQKKEIFSGLVVDARGLGISPILSPQILDENNMEIYGPAFISREIAVQKGICLYESDITAAKTNARVLNKPLVVKALRLKQPGGSELVISNTDALKIKSASEHLAFLKQCQVIIVLDMQDTSPDNS